MLDCATSHMNFITCQHFACKHSSDENAMSKMINAEILIKIQGETVAVIGVRSKGATFAIDILEKAGDNDRWNFKDLKNKRRWLKDSTVC